MYSMKKWRGRRHFFYRIAVPALTPTVGRTSIELQPTANTMRQTKHSSLFI